MTHYLPARSNPIRPKAKLNFPDHIQISVSGIGAVVKGVDSHPCGQGSIPGKKTCSFLMVSLSKSLSLCFMCSDQHVKYWMPCGFLLTSSLLLDYHIKQYITTYTHKIKNYIIRHHISHQSSFTKVFSIGYIILPIGYITITNRVADKQAVLSHSLHKPVYK